MTQTSVTFPPAVEGQLSVPDRLTCENDSNSSCILRSTLGR